VRLEQVKSVLHTVVENDAWKMDVKKELLELLTSVLSMVAANGV